MPVIASLALSAHQIAVAGKPSISTEELCVTIDVSNEFVGRPYFIWRHDPEIARHVNEHLTGQIL
jgi:hypothetical protein